MWGVGKAVMEGEAGTTEPRGDSARGPLRSHGARASPRPARVCFWKLAVWAPKFPGVIGSELTSFLRSAPRQRSAAACEVCFQRRLGALSSVSASVVAPASSDGHGFVAGVRCRRT